MFLFFIFQEKLNNYHLLACQSHKTVTISNSLIHSLTISHNISIFVPEQLLRYTQQIYPRNETKHYN